ncbi:hypothetical protein R5R35_005286 [Gryllus longicercus]|uniref:Leucine-rich repeat-containing protein 23 n=1 Tax=Gryllus longicercus TaxID=2509291 RepID=A0AAN9Z7Y2_9ORTH
MDEEEVDELFLGEEVTEGTPSEESEEGQQEIIPKALTKQEACSYLGLLGKPANALGIEVAYLQIKVNDKMLTDISIIPSFPHVMFVDVSRNVLNEEALSVLKDLKYLVKLEANENICATCKLPSFPFLQVLTLNKNKIELIDGLDSPVLECLELSYNRATQLKNIAPPNFQNLKILDLHGNYLETTAGIECPTIERLYLAENKIVKVEGLESLEKLQILHLRNNPIDNLSGFSRSMTSLTYINLRNCQIYNIKEVKKLTVLSQLDTLILWENPVVSSLGDEHRIQALSYVSTLKRINKEPVQQEEVEAAEEIKKQRESMEAEEAAAEELSEYEGEHELGADTEIEEIDDD